jgi:hypothetical protein|tara:strand:+ start:54 stop:257 length:204 start_codon:yes stop_codon:yes gene_type:complete
MKVTKEDIIYICWLPLILVALLMGAILMWTAWGLYFLFGGLAWVWEHVRTIDFRLNGYDKVKTNDRR